MSIFYRAGYDYGYGLTGSFFLLRSYFSNNQLTQRRVYKYDNDFDHRLLGYWSIRICLNLGNTHSFQETP
jgi:hypothetical protein